MTARRTPEESAALKVAIIERSTTTDATANAIASDLGCDPKYVRRVMLARGARIIIQARRR